MSAEDLRSRPSTPPTDEAINIRLGRTLVPRAGTEGLARWAATRRRHHPYGSLPRPGCAQGTIDALEKSAGMTARCLTEGCGALVDLRTARRAAVAAGRTHFVHGDGCASAPCSQCPQSARFQRRQMSMADALLDGMRTLAAWPVRPVARIEQWAEPAHVSDSTALAVMASAVGVRLESSLRSRAQLAKPM